jgi:hypothetical protein
MTAFHDTFRGSCCLSHMPDVADGPTMSPDPLTSRFLWNYTHTRISQEPTSQGGKSPWTKMMMSL